MWGENVASAKWAEQEGKVAALLFYQVLRTLTFCLVLTGEEEDETIHSVRGKLYVLSEQNQWKERGTGLLRLNVRRADGSGARLGRFYFVYTNVLENLSLRSPLSCRTK